MMYRGNPLSGLDTRSVVAWFLSVAWTSLTCSEQVSNLRPLACHASALPLSYQNKPS